MFFYRELITAEKINNERRSIAIGGFDGLHLGHKKILLNLYEDGKEKGNNTLILSFEPTPKEFFSPHNPPPRLTKFRERYNLIKNYKIDEFFCPNLKTVSHLTPSKFIKEILVDGLKVKSITIGDDFRFAAKRAGTLDDLYFGGKKYGFSVNVIPPVYKNNQRVSSTFIRDALAKGDLETAKNMLERDYSMSGRVIYGQGLGKKLGFPTANINLNRMRTPIDGIFAVRVGGINQGLLNGVASIGSRPTIGGKKKLLEVYQVEYHLLHTYKF